MPKAERGAKRTCPLCGTKFYDMQRQPPTCPKCRASSDESMRHWNHQEINKHWMDVVSIISDGKQKSRHNDARRQIEAINREWKRRRESEGFFEWPSTDARPGRGSFSSDPPEVGMLAYLGYHVRKGCPMPRARQQILLEVFRSELPPVNSLSYVDEWCEPESAGRLKKIAETIAALTRNNKRRKNSDSYRSAIENWEDDLRFLYNELYIKRFGFVWPSTE